MCFIPSANDRLEATVAYVHTVADIQVCV